MKKLISRRKFLAAMGTMAAAGALTACGGSSSGTASSAAASSTAASAAESWGDVKLTMWGAEEDQTMLREMADAFIEQNADKGNVTIEIGVQSESSAKDTVLADPESAADVFAFADDQLNELVNAGALQEVLLNPDDVKSRNLPGSVGAATMNDKLYAYPMTADNGYFLYYDASVLSAEDVQSVDTMLEKAAAAGKKFMMSVNDAWYIYSFYAGAGLVATLADDGINTVCNWPFWISPQIPALSPARMLISFLPSRTAAAAPPSPVLGTPAPPRRLGARATPPPSCQPTP